MWRKEERQDDVEAPRLPSMYDKRELTPASAPASPSPAAGAERATIGRTILLRGDVTGDEDLLIHGRVEGSVDLRLHALTVGREGEVVADILGRVVTIEGRVEGNIIGGEQVILRSSAHVKGDIRAPRVVLENGARFRGLVDMGEEEEQTVSPGTASGPDARRQTENGRVRTEASRASASGTGTESGDIASRRAGASAATPDSAASTSSSDAGKSKRQGDVDAQIPA